MLSHVWLFVTPWIVAHKDPLSMGSSRQEYWSGLPFPPPRDLPNSGIKAASPALQVDSLPLSHRRIADYYCLSLWCPIIIFLLVEDLVSVLMTADWSGRRLLKFGGDCWSLGAIFSNSQSKMVNGYHQFRGREKGEEDALMASGFSG